MNKEKALKRINPSIFKGVCHRGLHNEKITENSIEAFKNALNHNLAIELDVHLSKDNNLIVMHDASLKRTTSKEGIIENLTLQEIKDNYRLLNGEAIPTLQEVLSLVSEKVPLVIELKPYKQNYKALANRLKEELKDIKDAKNYLIISFYPQCLLYVKSLSINRLLLIGSNEYPYIFRHFFEGVDLDVELLKKPKYQKSINKRLTLSWTIDDDSKIEIAKKYSDCLTFQFVDPYSVSKE